MDETQQLFRDLEKAADQARQQQDQLDRFFQDAERATRETQMQIIRDQTYQGDWTYREKQEALAIAILIAIVILAGAFTIYRTQLLKLADNAFIGSLATAVRLKRRVGTVVSATRKRVRQRADEG